ncbi:restriction endonuclease subunit S [Nostoc sp. MG11]|uniref:restriction endonuclease subunit S n=1 Tax=Nostoc sp. MG11 TaxID=2721166 RepID=UPI001867EB51|nr:restriction endonuclease subunit S [Nostoc sp. MG11]
MTWAERKLDELGYVSRGRSRHRPHDDESLYGGNYPFIQTGDVKHSHFYIRSYTQTYNEKGLSQSRLWSAGTLCITIAANIADTAILSFNACFPYSIIGFIANPHICDVRYIKYFFDTVQARYKQIAQGAAQDNLSLQKLLTFSILTPPLTTQQRIADILSTYDNLIDNNNRRIALLQESIHQLYKEWFVRLHFPGYESVKVVDGIPEGWNRIDFSEALILQRGFDLPSKDRKSGDIPVYASTGINGFHDTPKVKAPGIVTGRSGTVGTVMYIHKDFWPLNTTL